MTPFFSFIRLIFYCRYTISSPYIPLLMTVIKNRAKKRKIYNTYIWNLEKWYR